MSPIIVQDEAEFHELVRDVFDQVTQRVSFAKKWAAKFLDFQKTGHHTENQESVGTERIPSRPTEAACPPTAMRQYPERGHERRMFEPSAAW